MSEKEDFLPLLGIPWKLEQDPEYINKARASICIDCVNNLGFGHEFYLCKIGHFVKVGYRKVGVFHTEIMECNKYEKEQI